ncbi:MAG: hypothetical protein ACP5KN_18040 [Armatimonadota bacterium]
MAVDADASGRAPQSLLVSARDAPLGHLLWALEVATGLQVRSLGETDLAEWAFAHDRYPDRAERPDRLLRLPSLQCRSPHRTSAGRALLSGVPTSAACARSAQGYHVDALPEWLRGLMLQSLPPPEFVGLPADTDYTALASEGRMVAVWPQGVHLEAGVFEADGFGSAVSVALPAF